MKKRKIVEALMKVLFGITACASILAVFLICLFMFMNGLPAIGKIGPAEFLGSTTWAPQDVPPKFGILTMIVGSLYVTAGAIIVGLPVGLLTAVFLARFCPKGLYKVLKPLVELLAGIPSIVYGFFGMVVLEMCIRDSHRAGPGPRPRAFEPRLRRRPPALGGVNDQDRRKARRSCV